VFSINLFLSILRLNCAIIDNQRVLFSGGRNAKLGYNQLRQRNLIPLLGNFGRESD